MKEQGANAREIQKWPLIRLSHRGHAVCVCVLELGVKEKKQSEWKK